MKRIEFIGGPAIGKTTVFKQVKALRSSSNDTWLTYKEARLDLAKNITINSLGSKKALQTVLKLGLSDRIKQKATSVLLNEISNSALDSIHVEYSDVADNFLEFVVGSTEMSGVQKLRLASYYNNLLLHGIMVFDYVNYDRLVVYEEGIIHNSSAFTNETLVGQVIFNHLQLGTSVIPKGVVHCNMNLEPYFQRRKERISKGKGIFLDRNLNDEKLWKLCQEQLKSAEKKAKALSEYGVEILTLNMEQSVNENSKKALDFIKYFQ